MDDKKAQLVALIDSIGWSRIELGELDRGETDVRHGLKLAEEVGDFSYVSKALRHLGVIRRKKRDFMEAERMYADALVAASKIADVQRKVEASAGISFAKAMLYLHTSKFPEALSEIDSAIAGFTETDDNYRVTMALTMKATICFSSCQLTEAKDLFRKALTRAQENSQRLQAVRCLLGLTKIYIADKQWLNAKENLEKAEKLCNDINSESEIAEIREIKAGMPN